ncbi:helix-turn-helix domain-containing protein [Vibrio viridaestus]|uniref:AraC family transcriptional regulator n=1 Tax=Vibrio viridaestus TaxID=2487322 RepID=A0A3N9TDS6_9VIBR|nr:AraC family transcriptional regulator [Vibrio viridaestus]RQW62229.1 AraC family transcriptional regulator [Vibrio viridaestus]
MLSIPVPFVVSLLLVILAITLYARMAEQSKTACLFVGLCALTTAIVGLRWAYDWTFLRYLQPLLAALIPVFAWFNFSSLPKMRFFVRHSVGPILVCIFVVTQRLWTPPLDELITLMYLVYSWMLFRFGIHENQLSHISLGYWDTVRFAAKLAGGMLLFSAAIDTAMSLDFIFNHGKAALYILTAGNLIMLPLLSCSVILAGIYTPSESNADNGEKSEVPNPVVSVEPLISAERAKEIVTLLDAYMKEKQIYLDPDLTLSKLSRKLVIPAKQISIAVNQIQQKNISKLINEYRIEHAMHALENSDDTITQIFMNCGFQTKSNFNREFSRITGKTPSEYRKSV